MPVKSQPRAPTDTVRMRGRTNTNTSVTSKTGVSTSKRTGGQGKENSGTTRITSGGTSFVIGTHLHGSTYPKPPKIITVVDDTNIEEVLNLPDVSSIPASFLTEIQQDKIYETILSELRKKLPRLNLRRTPSIQEEDEEKLFSPHLLAIDDDDDDISVDQEISSSSSSETNEIPTHDGYDTDIEAEPADGGSHDPTGREQYREACEQAKIVPCSYFMAHIEDNEMILRYHQFNTDDIRVIAKNLCSNLTIERLFLDGNYLQEQSAKYITRLIATNDFITELSLADNRLGGGEGTKDICKMLTINRNLKKINLSGNKFSEVDATQLIEAFEENKTLHELDLSHNCFGEQCGKLLGTYISGNYTIETINLGWNNFRGRSAIDLINGIKENSMLKHCNLEMNGFGPECGQAIADCIKQNNTLEDLNLNGNRLNTTNAFVIGQALATNETLQTFRIADNQINSDGVLAICLCIKTNPANKLQEIDFSHTVVTQETANICEDIVKLKDGNFKYYIGKITPENLKPNSTSELYIKTNEDLLNKLRSTAANVKPNVE